ncbi:MAG: MBL fold metallo-hydrolase [Chloroflexota bacterium]
MRDLVPIAPNIFIYPRDETPNIIQPNIGVLRRNHETILIDAGNSPRHARQIISVVNAHGLPPITGIILTHHHWDHSFAATSFDVTQLIAHRKCAEKLNEVAKRDWSVELLQAEIADNPKREISNNAMIDAIPNWHHLQIARPTMTFASTLTLHHDTMPIELWHVGGRHAEDSIVVHLPEQNVMFVGDSYYPEPYHMRAEGDEDLDLEMLDSFLEVGCDMYIDGHGAPRDRDAFTQMIEWERGRQAAET